MIKRKKKVEVNFFHHRTKKSKYLVVKDLVKYQKIECTCMLQNGHKTKEQNFSFLLAIGQGHITEISEAHCLHQGNQSHTSAWP